MHGGPQERKLRAGTENVQGVVGFAEAVRLAMEEREENWARWVSLREVLYRLPRELEAVRVNTDPDLSVPNCVNMAFMFCDGMALATNLSARGVFISQGSACTAGDLQPSHVLKAMGISDRAHHRPEELSGGADGGGGDQQEHRRTPEARDCARGHREVQGRLPLLPDAYIGPGGSRCTLATQVRRG